MWARLAQITRPSTDPETNGQISAQNGWVKLGPTYSFFLISGTGWTQPSQLGWAKTGPARSNLVTGIAQ
jgi:hypothetical protein